MRSLRRTLPALPSVRVWLPGAALVFFAATAAAQPLAQPYGMVHGESSGLPQGPATRVVARGDTVFVQLEQGTYSVERPQRSPDDTVEAQLQQARSARWRAAGSALPTEPSEATRAAADRLAGVEPRDARSGTAWPALQATDLVVGGARRHWLATDQGVGAYDTRTRQFTLWEPADGLPWHEITAIAPAPDGTVWLGTTRGLLHLLPNWDDPPRSTWEVRQGRRFVPHDHVHDVAVDTGGDVWVATEGGVGQIALLRTTLGEKAAFFDREIDAHHQRTEYGYVDARILSEPGDRSTATLRSSDNDGLWTSMYGAAQAFAWAATRDPEARRRAQRAFRAVAFLSEVTQGGTPDAQPGFPARSILPTAGPDPNVGQEERDRQTQQSDRKWKSIQPRWPVSADGTWYWKSDTSSDELDGHYFFYAQYYDLVADSEEKARVRQVVHRITDHLLRNGFALRDHDGELTRWAVFGPDALNHDPSWWEERGLNSMSVLSYLRVAEHVSESPAQGAKYADAARALIEDHGYAANARAPKVHEGPGTGNQSDDEMAFMNFYNLIRYEKDEALAAQWAHSFYRYWRNEAPERNPLFNYLFAGALAGRDIRYRDAYDDFVPGPEGAWREDALDTLVRYPLDRTDWGLTNSHRHDVTLLRSSTDARPKGHLRDGKVLPIDERFVGHWNHDPWTLDYGGQGLRVADGASYLLPYFLGLYHGFIER